MKWTLCLLCVASVTTALPARDKRGFSLFSVVTFPNEACTTTMTPAMTGICVTAEECANSGDIVATASGNCASGFGVCCFRSIEGEGAITQDVVHVQSAGFPSNEATLESTNPVPSATTRAYNIMGGANICQIRLDIMSGTNLLAPEAVGDCPDGEGITITTEDKQNSAQNGISALCGALGDQHLYVDVSSTSNSAMAATLNIDTAGSSGARKWKILVRQVECNDGDLRAPSGCRQYHTATSGRISSFNGANSVATADTQAMIRNTRYSICIKRATGMTSVTLREAGGASDSFRLDNTALTNNAATSSVGDAAAAMAGMPGGCTEAFISFAGTRYCGALLSSVPQSTVAGPVTGTAFTIGVVAGNTATGGANSGFDLIYTQT